MELRYFLIFCLFSTSHSSENEAELSQVVGEESEEVSKSITLSINRGISDEKSSGEKNSDESIDRSPTNHLPYSHGHSPYVQMVFKLAAEAVEASDASQRISHQLSMNHGHGHSGAMVKVRLPLYKQSYPVLFQHGHIMHDVMDGLPYPYVPTMKARPSTGHRNMEKHAEENLISHGLALAHGQRNGHQAPHY